MTEGLGPKPDAKTEEPELLPGGADSLDDEKYGETPGEQTTPDIRPEDNPAVEDVLPDEIAEEDDKQQEPTEGGEDIEQPEPPA